MASSRGFKYSEIKPLLRPLESMTLEEQKEIEATKVFQLVADAPQTGVMIPTAETFRLLLSKHFDLFNLIPEGLALPLTTQTSIK